MARLPRVTSKLFAENATEVGQFGSLNAGTKVTTTDIATIQGLPAWSNGWQAATLGDNCYPTLQERNGLDKVQSYMTNYLYQEGVPEWDAGTTYYVGNLVKLINGTNVQIYKSMVDNNTAALSDTTSWEEWNYANSDLSNLSSTGQHVIDGQWVGSTKLLVTGGSFSADTNIKYDLSTYLPNDNYKYEVLGSLYGSTLETSGKYVNMYVKSSECSSLTVASATTRTSSRVRFGGLFIIPIGTNRTITFKDTGNGGIELEIVIQAYRRIGTNA